MLVAPERLDIIMGMQTVAEAPLLNWVWQKCLLLDPTNSNALIDIANALAPSFGRAFAIRCLKKCLVGKPAEPAASFNLANFLREDRQLDAAEPAYARAATLDANSVKVWNNWGLLAFASKGWREARKRLTIATRTDAQFAQAWSNLSRAIQPMEGEAPSIPPMKRGLILDPQNVSGTCEISTLVQQQHWARFAHCLNPLYHRPYIRLALFGAEEEDRPNVLSLLRKAAVTEPNMPNCWYNLGVETGRGGEAESAIRYSQFATLIEDDRPVAHLNMSLYLLLLERFEIGWEAHRRRVECPDANAFNRYFAIPEWQGEDLAGRHLLLWGEQGIGDEVQFLTLAHELLQQGARLTILTEPRLRPIVRRSFDASRVSVPDVNSPNGQQESHHGADYHLALGDLPHRLKLFCGGEARPRPWITADADWSRELRAGLQARNPGKFLIGITWRSKAPKTGGKRTMAPALWRPLSQIKDAAFVSLQYGAVLEDNALFQDEAGIDLDTDHGIEPLETLDGLTALVDAIDLVLCPTNNTVHFAGAMGKPCWTLLPHFPDWRWGLNRSDSLWYPDTRIFRQPKEDDWGSVIENVHAALVEQAQSDFQDFRND